MPALLLVIIYLIFISLGLPDGVFGSAWPAMHVSLGAPVGLGGLVSFVATCMAIASSLGTAYFVKKLGIGKLILISIALTACGLVGYSTVHHAGWLVIFAVPLGFGAGAIDSSLNNYVATHYKVHHMNWLHAFWGVGASLGPLIFAASLKSTNDWHSGFLKLGLIQAAIAVIVLFSLSLWGRVKLHAAKENTDSSDIIHTKFGSLLRQRNARLAFVSFLLYVGVEVSIGLWAATYLVNIQGFDFTTAAFWTGIYYAAITAGRFLTGLISFKVSTTMMVRAGIALSLLGMVTVFTNVTPLTSAIGMVLIGLGFAPIYPSLIHQTPEKFGVRNSAKAMSLQMVGGYIGATTLPPIVGIVSGQFTFLAFAMIMSVCTVILLVTTELLNAQQKNE